MSASAVRTGAQPADQHERDRIVTRTDETLFVEAGAGTGKTRALTGRVVELLTGPTAVPISAIAAITFTDKAAAELRNRIRAALNQLLADGSPEQVAERARLALAGLDSAAISTLHGFARRILSEHAIEARVPPLFEALDQIASDVEFDERWSRFEEQLLSDPTARWAVEFADAAGAGPSTLREVGVRFNANWDRVRVGSSIAAMAIDVDEVLELGHALSARSDECSATDDPLLLRFPQLDRYLALLGTAPSDAGRLSVLCSADDSQLGIPKVGRTGRAANWADVGSVRDGFEEVRVRCLAIAAAALDSAVAELSNRVAQFTIDAAEQRRSAGRLEFHDLLVHARDLLRRSPSARAALHGRYRHLLLDEFQDTDPIQVEIAALIAGQQAHGEGDGDDGADVSLGSARESGAAPNPHWSEIATTAGGLFFVGDPKQSIYRFRRADIGLYLDAQRRYEAETGATASLRVNFRTTEPVIAWVNSVFAELMPPHHESEHAHLHPPYVPLESDRAAIVGSPAVMVLGTEQHTGVKVEQVREIESADVAAAIVQVMNEQWLVAERHGAGGAPPRPARLSDIAVLLPSRTSLPQLETGLAVAGIPYRLEASEFVWRSRTVRDLLMCLRAAADPDDDLAIVSALRTPLYGCGDDDLYTYYRAIGSWSYFRSGASPQNGAEQHPVTEGLAHLRELYELHSVMAPSMLIDRLVRDRKFLEQAAAGPRTREKWRHVRYLIDQARAWTESQHGGLRGFLRWTEMQSSKRAKVTEAILPESDDDSVQVMTIHAAKGLEFPIVIVAGLQVGEPTAPPPVIFGAEDTAHDADSGDRSHTCGGASAVRLRSGVESLAFARCKDEEQIADHHERVRLLYVACTRARDHLIVSLHRPPPRRRALHEQSHAHVIQQVLPHSDEADRAAREALQWEYRAEARSPNEASAPAQTEARESSDVRPERTAWLRRRDHAAAHSRRRTALSATAIAQHSARDDSGFDHGHGVDAGESAEPLVEPADALTPAKDEADDDPSGRSTPMRRGRGATATGKAVHGVLQAVDLRSGDDLAGLAAAQATAEGVGSNAASIEAFVRSALGSDEVQRAVANRHWREVYAAAAVDAADPAQDSVDDGAGALPVVEGFIDLLYDDPDMGGLVVVDYKTDALGAMPGADSGRAAQYRQQCATYAWCIERATGRQVARIVLLYLRSDGMPANVDRLEGIELQRLIDTVPQAALELAVAEV